MRGWRSRRSASAAGRPGAPLAAPAATDERAAASALKELEDKVQYVNDLEQEVQLLKRRSR